MSVSLTKNIHVFKTSVLSHSFKVKISGHSQHCVSSLSANILNFIEALYIWAGMQMKKKCLKEKQISLLHHLEIY